MANPLFNMMMSNMANSNPQMNIIKQFLDFKNNFRGNPYQEIQKMMNSGRISQEQYNQAVQTAQQFQMLLNNKH